MNWDTEYLDLIRKFAAACDADPNQLDPSGEILLHFDGLTAAIYPNAGLKSLVIDIDIFRLENPQADPANFERLLMLHRMNSITRFTHGAMAFVTGDNVLTLSRSVGVRDLDGEGLAALLIQMVDAANQLADAWTDMRQLMASTLASLDASTHGAKPAVQPGPSTFA